MYIRKFTDLLDQIYTFAIYRKSYPSHSGIDLNVEISIFPLANRFV